MKVVHKFLLNSCQNRVKTGLEVLKFEVILINLWLKDKTKLMRFFILFFIQSG